MNTLVTADPFYAHTGECLQCRNVMEAFFAEMPYPGPLCETGRQILVALVTQEPVVISKEKHEPTVHL